VAFNNVGNPIWVDAGGMAYWWYTFDDNRAAQYAMANCKTPDAEMDTVSEGNRLNDDGTVTYFVAFHNVGPRPCFHNLNGGGLT
jgi:hypothetical protein